MRQKSPAAERKSPSKRSPGRPRSEEARVAILDEQLLGEVQQREALDRLLAAAIAVVEDLHRDLFADVDVLASVDDAHPAASDNLVQLVLAHRGTGSGVGRNDSVQIRLAGRIGAFAGGSF